MKSIAIKTKNASAAVFSALEKKGLIKVVRPTAKVLNTRTKTGAVDLIYRSGKGSRGHCLLGIGKRNTEIEFSSHPGNEELILLKPASKSYKSLYLVLSLLKKDGFLKALKKEGLSSRDFTAVKLEYNKPGTMYFTVLKNTVHCEITDKGAGQHPVFFVSEPDGLKMERFKTKKYGFRLEK